MQRLRIFLCSIVIIVCGVTAILVARPGISHAAQTFANPILNNQADAFMAYNNGNYYLIYSNYTTTIFIRKSPTIEGIKTAAAVTIFTAPSSGPVSQQVWSPSMALINGTWYVYFSADADSNVANHHQYVLQADTNDPQGSYTFKGPIVDPYDPNNARCAIGTAVPLLWNNAWYLFYTGCGASTLNYQNWVVVQRLSNPWTFDTDRVVVDRPTYGWEGVINEGPAPFVHNGKVYILHSASDHLDTGNPYKLALVTNSDGNLLNASSYVKNTTPVFQGGCTNQGCAYRPGSSSVVPSPDGTQTWLVYQGSDVLNTTGDPISIRAQPFLGWNSDGSPNLGSPIPGGVQIPVPSGEGMSGSPTPTPTGFATGFEGGEPQPTWNNAVDNNTAPAGGSSNIGGICCGLTGPEAGTRTELAHSGSSALMYSGFATNSGGTDYAYMKVFDLSGQTLTIGASTTLSYWIYPQSSSSDSLISGNNSTCVAIDLILQDSNGNQSDLRDSGAVDQNGNRAHPASQCGKLTLDSWNHVTVNLSAHSNGLKVVRVDIAYDQPNSTGGYRGYLDEISIQ